MAAPPIGFALRQVRIDQLVPSRGLIICKEISTGHSMEVSVLPMRVRLPKVGEQWLIDRTYGHWSFASLISSPDLFEVGAGGGGEAGEPGPPGPANTLTIGTVEPGLVAGATITGEAPDQVLDLVLPQGNPGSPGPPGADSTVPGPPGPANVITIGTVDSGAEPEASITGESPDQVLNLTLPKGDPGAPGAPGTPGAPGDPGPANTLTVGTVTTLSAGSPVTVTITGQAPEQVLNLGLPQGAPGDPGAPGAPGDPGAPGEPGPPGPANTLTVGAVTDLAPGQSPTATITGEAPSQVLDLGLVRGDKGDPGDPGADSTVPGPPGPPNVLSIGTVTTLDPEAAATVTITGQAPEQVLSLGLPAGHQGEPGSPGAPGADSTVPGPPGPANTLTIGTVTTLSPDAEATATITGEAPVQTLDLGLVKGDKGDPGAPGADGTFAWVGTTPPPGDPTTWVVGQLWVDVS